MAYGVASSCGFKDEGFAVLRQVSEQDRFEVMAFDSLGNQLWNTPILSQELQVGNSLIPARATVLKVDSTGFFQQSHMQYGSEYGAVPSVVEMDGGWMGTGFINGGDVFVFKRGCLNLCVNGHVL